jgi:hypothetical protein
MTRRTLLDQLELELRRLPGVAGVGFSEDDGLVVVHVLAAIPDGLPSLRRQIVQRARGFVDRPLVVDVQEVRIGAEALPPERGRVKLIGVRIEAFTQEMEVHLAHRGVHSVGRGAAGSPADAAGATMQALAELGAELPFRVEAAATPVADEDTQQAVIVILEPEGDARGTRYGVARGETLEEAAARATLHALNRYLSRGAPLSSAS